MFCELLLLSWSLSIALNLSFVHLMSPALYLITATALELISITTLLEFSFETSEFPLSYENILFSLFPSFPTS